MSSPKYTMVTVASCEPGFLNDALGHVGTLCGDLRKDAGAVATRYGVLTTGEHVGSIVLLQTYTEMNGIDAAFGVYGKSAAYDSLIGSGKIAVTLRNLLKIEPLELAGQSTDNVPAYGVLTRWGAGDPMIERAKKLLPVFKSGGAMFMRYFTILTGSNAGRRLLAVGYPSMAAIQDTYDGLMASTDYASFVADIEIDFRNIVRVAG